MSWQAKATCREHGEASCDCEPFMRIAAWELRNDACDVIGVVQQFGGDESPYYGRTAYGRTGAMGDRLRCQAAVEKMIETGFTGKHSS